MAALVGPIEKMRTVFTSFICHGIHVEQRVHQIVSARDVGNKRVQKEDEAKLPFLRAVTICRIPQVRDNVVSLYPIYGRLRSNPTIKVERQNDLADPVLVRSSPVKNRWASWLALFYFLKKVFYGIHIYGVHILAYSTRLNLAGLRLIIIQIGCKFVSHSNVIIVCW